eukprot:5863335-Pyramimonas_sp.AAC.1
MWRPTTFQSNGQESVENVIQCWVPRLPHVSLQGVPGGQLLDVAWHVLVWGVAEVPPRDVRQYVRTGCRAAG